MINNNGFSLDSTLTNQDINLTFTPPSDAYSFEYTVYKDGEIYLNNSNVNVPVNFNFTDTGTYSIQVIVADINGYSTFTSPEYTIDKENPVIAVKEDKITIEQGSNLNLFSNVTVIDNYDSNLKEQLTTNYNELNFTTVGQKKLVYTVNDNAGNTTSKMIQVNVIKQQSPYLIFIQSGILLALLVFLIAILRYRRGFKLENRIAKFSVQPLEDNEVSLLDKLSTILTKYIKKESEFLNKSTILRKYAKYFEKYTVIYNRELTSTDLVSIKLIFGIIFVIVAVCTFALKFRVLHIYEWIIPFLAGILILDIYNAIKYRIYRNKIENDLLQAIIIMNNAFKSGRSISQAVNLVTTELDGPIAKEFSKIYVELSFGLDLNTVFKRFAERVNVEETSYLTASLTILNKTGGNIVKVFGAIEKSLFSKKKLKLELNALTSSSKVIKNILFVVPVAFFILISLIDSNYFSVFFTTNIGMILFAFILILYVSYILLVNKIMKVRM
jgi:tight adherence protein B